MKTVIQENLLKELLIRTKIILRRPSFLLTLMAIHFPLSI